MARFSWVDSLPTFHTHLVQWAIALLPPLCPVVKGKWVMFVFLLEVIAGEGPMTFFELLKKRMPRTGPCRSTRKHKDVLMLRSITMPCKTFFLLSLAPTHSSTTYLCPCLPYMSGTTLNYQQSYTTGMSLNCNPDSFSGTMLNCQLGFPLQVLWTTGTSLNYHLESHDMPSGHMLPPPVGQFWQPITYIVMHHKRRKLGSLVFTSQAVIILYSAK